MSDQAAPVNSNPSTPTGTIPGMSADALKPTVPVRPPNFNGGAMELQALLNELQTVNNPALQNQPQTEAEVLNPQLATRKLAQLVGEPAGSTVSRPQVLSPAQAAARDGMDATVMPGDPVFDSGIGPVAGKVMLSPAPAAVIPAPPAPVTVQPPSRILLTGRTGVGKNFLAAQVANAVVVELDQPVREALQRVWPNCPESESFIKLVMAWGDGVVSAQYPVTPARISFIVDVNRRDGFAYWPGFGTPGYWVGRLKEKLSETPGQVIITKVEHPDIFRALIELGFRHYHVVCSSITYGTRPKRKDADDGLAATLDLSMTKEISLNRTGGRLRCIWSDTTPPPSGRLFRVQDWVQAVTPAAAPVMTGE